MAFFVSGSMTNPPRVLSSAIVAGTAFFQAEVESSIFSGRIGFQTLPFPGHSYGAVGSNQPLSRVRPRGWAPTQK